MERKAWPLFGMMEPRDWNVVKEEDEEASTTSAITVVQFNMLARDLADNVAFPDAHVDHLNYENRKERLVAELKRANADLVVLQEVDGKDYESFLGGALSELCYASRFTRKLGGHTDGCVLAWNMYKFDRPMPVSVFWEAMGGVDEMFCGTLPGNSQVYAYMTLIHLETNKRIRFATTHLKAKPGFEELREQQVQTIVKSFERDYRQNQHRIERKKTEEEEVDRTFDELILCGDLNDVPGSLCYTYLETQTTIPLTSCYASYPQREEDVRAVAPYNVERTVCEAPFTTYKHRGKGVVVCRTIDYIWTTSGLCTTALLDIPWPPPLHGFPSDVYPSDHIMIAAQVNVAP